MKTKILMTASATVMGVAGIVLSFLPEEILAFLDPRPSLMFEIILQLLGGLYFGFAMVNWMSKGIRMGGIYNRPLAMGNLAHFSIGALSLVKVAVTIDNVAPLWAAATIYAFFGISFGYIVFSDPLKATE